MKTFYQKEKKIMVFVPAANINLFWKTVLIIILILLIQLMIALKTTKTSVSNRKSTYLQLNMETV